MSRSLPAVGVGVEDDVLELLDVAQPAERAERDLELAGRRRDRLLADRAGGHLGVLLANGRDDVAGRQVARRQLAGIDPDAHAVIALAEQEDVADARRTRASSSLICSTA